MEKRLVHADWWVVVDWNSGTQAEVVRGEELQAVAAELAESDYPLTTETDGELLAAADVEADEDGFFDARMLALECCLGWHSNASCEAYVAQGYFWQPDSSDPWWEGPYESIEAAVAGAISVYGESLDITIRMKDGDR